MAQRLQHNEQQSLTFSNACTVLRVLLLVYTMHLDVQVRNWQSP